MNEILKEIHVHESTDPNNEEGVTYTIGYPKNK